MQKTHTHTYIKGNRKFFFFFFKMWFQNKNWAMLQFQKDPNEIEAKFQNKNRRLPKVSTTVHLKRVCRQFPSMTPSHDQKKKKKNTHSKLLNKTTLINTKKQSKKYDKVNLTKPHIVNATQSHQFQYPHSSFLSLITANP